MVTTALQNNILSVVQIIMVDVLLKYTESKSPYYAGIMLDTFSYLHIMLKIMLT